MNSTVDEHKVYNLTVVRQNHDATRKSHSKIAPRQSGKLTLQFIRKRFRSLLESRRQSAFPAQMLFQSGRQISAPLGQARREIAVIRLKVIANQPCISFGENQCII